MTRRRAETGDLDVCQWEAWAAGAWRVRELFRHARPAEDEGGPEKWAFCARLARFAEGQAQDLDAALGRSPTGKRKRGTTAAAAAAARPSEPARGPERG